jgi:hypothetical protein
MFPTALVEHYVEEVRHIASGENSRSARFEMLVDQNAVAKQDTAVV